RARLRWENPMKSKSKSKRRKSNPDKPTVAVRIDADLWRMFTKIPKACGSVYEVEQFLIKCVRRSGTPRALDSEEGDENPSTTRAFLLALAGMCDAALVEANQMDSLLYHLRDGMLGAMNHYQNRLTDAQEVEWYGHLQRLAGGNASVH